MRCKMSCVQDIPLQLFGKVFTYRGDGAIDETQADLVSS